MEACSGDAERSKYFRRHIAHPSPPDQPQSKAGLAEAVRIINQVGPGTNIAGAETETDTDEKLLLEMGFF
ncbi:hypothetical protein TOC8171_42100 [Pseudomonas syringae]